ncbi:MAG: peptidoglycan DD-metalloendopeptidase family protein [Spirochaetaceae bacterium]|nr:peptidoglycan DD-metalloendopeptidase family protein [Spirochaetaceae bacterium]MCF7951717.1 peptidoglycan DD-metalloendopeptidase family protein [Spirochaetaceae bacterium]
MSKKLEQLLLRQAKALVLPFDPDREECVLFDFTEDNPELQGIDPADTAKFSDYVFGKMRHAGSRVGLGGYKEDRSIYRHSGLFAQGKVRSFHLGIDLWVESGTPVLAPYDGQVHSFQENRGIGDYGPTIILSHTLEGVQFYTLYGHLSRESLTWPSPGQVVSAGQTIAEVGDSNVNGNWPPHLHFEVIEDLGGRRGDFPGVCAPEDREEFLKVCPDPNLVLKLQALGPVP